VGVPLQIRVNASVGEVEFIDVWDEAYAAIMRYSRATDGFWVSTISWVALDILRIQHQYRIVNMNNGDVAFFTIDSLSAFWPGLQVLAGDVQSAIRLHMICEGLSGLFLFCSWCCQPDYNLWREHSGLPEVYDTNHRRATSHQYPLRPGTIPLSICETFLNSTTSEEFIESTWYLYRVSCSTNPIQ